MNAGASGVVGGDMEVPNGISLRVEGSRIFVKGPKGELSVGYPPLEAKVSAKGSILEVVAVKMLANTLEAHVRNMVEGLTNGYSRKLKVLYSHFPLSIEVKGKEMLIKNFLGEKQPRKARIVGSAKVEVKGQEVTISGISKEEVGQTVANIKSATKIKNRDHRVFQDGLYPVSEL